MNRYCNQQDAGTPESNSCFLCRLTTFLLGVHLGVRRLCMCALAMTGLAICLSSSARALEGGLARTSVPPPGKAATHESWFLLKACSVICRCRWQGDTWPGGAPKIIMVSFRLHWPLGYVGLLGVRGCRRGVGHMVKRSLLCGEESPRPGSGALVWHKRHRSHSLYPLRVQGPCMR